MRLITTLFEAGMGASLLSDSGSCNQCGFVSFGLDPDILLRTNKHHATKVASSPLRSG